jgi:glutathione S-transferase
MYQLYFMPNACSLATQVILRELQQPFTLIRRDQVQNYTDLDPANQVPLLRTDKQSISEGAAIILFLLQQHPNRWTDGKWPDLGQLQDLLFANATMHPAYGKLFFLAGAEMNPDDKNNLLQNAARRINTLWQVVEQRLQHQPFLAGSAAGVADILLTVYQRWDQFFDLPIVQGPLTQKMLATVRALPSFEAALAAEQAA